MNKELLKIVAGFILMVAVTPAMQAQRVIPLTVKQFLDEQAFNKHLPAGVRSIDSFSRFFPARMVDGQEMVDAFIAINDMKAIDKLQAAGVIINCCFDGFVTAQIPVDDLSAISQMPCVTDVEISRKMVLCTDSTLSVTHAGQVLDGENYGLKQSYDGTGVIVAMLDVGFDYQHLAFRRQDDPSVTRIVRVYSTTDRSGHPARFNGTIRLPGSVFMGNEIYSLKTDDATNSHGTHTTGIAAGTHVGQYGGMAPGADIVLCALSVLDGTISATEIANCLRYVDSYADSVGKPCVMSMSISAFSGSHDGQDYLSTVVNQLMGPGRFFVFAAGNNGNLRTYASKEATAESPLNLLLAYNNTSSADSAYNYRLCMTEFWMRSSSINMNYQFHILDRNTSTIVWKSEVFSSSSFIDVSEIRDYFTFSSSVDTTGYIKGQLNYSVYGKKYQLNLTLRNLINKNYTTVNGVKKGSYSIGISLWPKSNTPAYIDAWTCNSSTGFSHWKTPVLSDNGLFYNFYSPASSACSINSYGVCDSIFCVGAYAARNSYFSLFQNRTVVDRTIKVGDAASFSSYQAEGAGPTGKPLPTICAPGCLVVSSVNRYSFYGRSSSTMTVKNEGGHYWGVMSGTSMATPTVAGILAQWLQAYPTLSIAEAKEIMSLTGIRDEFTTGARAAQFGAYGKIDAMAGIRLILERTHHPIGDVNRDDQINLGDLSDLIDYIISKGSSAIDNFDKIAADVNQDGLINIGDLTDLIDMLLGRL